MERDYSAVAAQSALSSDHEYVQFLVAQNYDHAGLIHSDADVQPVNCLINLVDNRYHNWCTSSLIVQNLSNFVA